MTTQSQLCYSVRAFRAARILRAYFHNDTQQINGAHPERPPENESTQGREKAKNGSIDGPVTGRGFEALSYT